MKKRFLSIFIAINIIIAAFNPVLISAYYKTNSYSSVYSYDSYYEKLKEFDFTIEEMIALYQKEANQMGIDLKLPEKLAEASGITQVFHMKEFTNTNKENNRIFTTYSYDGQIRYLTYTFDFDELARYFGWIGGISAVAFIKNRVSEDALAKYIVTNMGLGTLFAVVNIASLILSGLSASDILHGFKIYTKQRYQYDEYEGFGKWYLLEISHKFY
ncbi:MAG: hypothetical protein Q4E36_01275 [Bacillota bacterium]|nr:hypothetical protein [Bacillota bacterium]